MHATGSVSEDRDDATGPPLDVVIAGGGVAAFETALAVRDLAGPLVSLTVIAPEAELVEEQVTVAEAFAGAPARHHPVADLVARTGGRLVCDHLHCVHPEAHEVGLAGGDTVSYDVLVLAVGAERRTTDPHALTYLGAESSAALARLRDDVCAGRVTRVALVVPDEVSWPLPLYEIAILLADAASAARADAARLWLLTPEDGPLAAFGRRSSQAVATLLARSGVTFVGPVSPEVGAGGVAFGPHRRIDVDRVVTLPRLCGRRVPGVPCDADGFVPVDEFGRVQEVFDVFAVGDGTSQPVKQGGLATQQADAAATAIAAEAGAPVDPTPFRPVLRSLLLKPGTPLFMRRVLGRAHDEGDAVEEELWWPPDKVAGRYLASYLNPDAPDPAPPSGTEPGHDVERLGPPRSRS
jgi:sulfide:quinone oxidoreductase